MYTSSSKLALVGDIGGSHARFALARLAGSVPAIEAVEQLSTKDYATLADAARHYLQRLPRESAPLRAVLAVASPVTGDQIKITNNPWSFSVAQLARELGFASVEVINDFAAISLALPLLGAADLKVIGPELPAPPKADRTYAVVGPGTGLGVSGLTVRGGRSAVIESEGGHIGYAPVTPHEIDILRELTARFGRVSAERLASGTGVVNLYQAVCALQGVPAPHAEAAAIAAEAAADANSVSARVLRLFCEILGGFAGDIALSYGAWDGVFLAGGVAQKLCSWIEQGGFRERFEAKGRHQGLMQSVPTWLIVNPHVGLLGAAAAVGSE
ncbi:MAG TPA: glucokinase [Nevskiaceae bacterium]|nr:glucokinase [Nevskiaceae bacterium]